MGLRALLDFSPLTSGFVGRLAAVGSRARTFALVLLVLACAPPRAGAAPKTDVITLRNGEHITGEILRLQRGKLDLSTDDAGTISFEWDKVARVAADRWFEVGTSDGQRFFGRLGPAADYSLDVVGIDSTVTLPMARVTLVTPIGASFWRKLDGSIDVGFSYTRSSGIAQVNVNSDTVYRKPKFEAALNVSLTGTRQEDGGADDDRGWLQASYVRFPWARWFVGGTVRFESNESLGLRLRSQVGGAVGPRLIDTNRAQMLVGGGLVVNDERGVDTAPTRNVEALLTFQSAYFTYDRPKTNLDVSLQYYPSLSEWGRQRLQLDVSAKQELFKDLFAAVDVFDTFDSRPPNAGFANNDIGVVLSLGWSY
jgi:hypothetical protein